MAGTTRKVSSALQQFASQAENSGQDLQSRLNALVSNLAGLVPTVWKGAAASVFTNAVVPAVQAEMTGLVATLNELASDVRSGDTQLSAQDTSNQADINSIVSQLSAIPTS